jgi:hypothetical protein
LNFIVTDTTSTNIQFTNCPPYTGKPNNNAESLLRLIMGGNPMKIGNPRSNGFHLYMAGFMPHMF